jgi:hypothetical protein
MHSRLENTMQAGTSTGQENDRHFALDLLGLIARVIVAAVAINVVFAAFVLLLAGQAQAATTAAALPQTVAHETETIRMCPVAPAALPDELKLTIIHRFGGPATGDRVREY